MTSGLVNATVIGDSEIEIERIEYDSREVGPGTLFVAITGYTEDGWDYVPDAIEAGAVAVMGRKESCPGVDNYVRVSNVRAALSEIAARLYGYPGRKMRICGVTGTNGKTTTAHLIRTILQARGKRVGLISSVIYDTCGDTFTANRTTPESLEIQRLLLLMKRNQCVSAVIEVSSHALALHRVDDVPFQVAVFTNLTRDHLDFHKTMEEYLKAKKLLLKKLHGAFSYAVVNRDVPEFRSLIGDYGTSYLTYSLSDNEADIYCSHYEFRPTGTRFELITPMGERSVKLPLVGRFNLMNAVAAAAASLASGVDLDTVILGLEQAQPVPGRLEAVDCGQPFSVLLDFAHTPDAIERLCESASEITSGKMLILFGCGGDRDSGKRPLMGAAASQGADYSIITSDNPRSEDPDEIINEIKPGMETDQFRVVSDRAEAIKIILGMAHEGDIVLLAGKGSEDYQEIKGERFTFSDRVEAEKVLTEMGHKKMMADEGN